MRFAAQTGFDVDNLYKSTRYEDIFIFLPGCRKLMRSALIEHPITENRNISYRYNYIFLNLYQNVDKAEPQARTDRRYVTKRCFVPDSSLRTKATGAERHALDRICAKAKLARLHGGESILFLAGKRWFSCARTRNPGRDAGISLWNKRMTFKHRQGDQDARTSMVGRTGRKCSQGRACLAGELLRPVTGGGFGQTGRRRLRRAHVDRFFWCLGGTAVRSPGQSVVPSTQSAGRALFFCSGRCGLRTMAAALLGCMPLRAHSHRRHAAERDSASAGRGHGPYRRHRRRADPAAGLLVCCSPLPGGCCPHAGCCLVHDGSDISVGPPVRSCARERGRDDGSPYPVRKVKFTGGWAGSRLSHDRIGGSGREGAVLPVCSLLSLCLACGKGIGYIIKGVTEALSSSGYSLFKGDC